MSEFKVEDKVTVTDKYPEAEMHGKTGIVVGFDHPYTLVKLEDAVWSQRYYAQEIKPFETPVEDALQELGQAYLDRLEQAADEGTVFDDLWRLGFVTAFINEVEDALQ